jgi:hypothetical protein
MISGVEALFLCYSNLMVLGNVALLRNITFLGLIRCIRQQHNVNAIFVVLVLRFSSYRLMHQKHKRPAYEAGLKGCIKRY